jgi:glycerol-3-phosphate acyltransferase PlsY
METVLAYGVSAALSYLLGSIPFGYLLGRMGGIDIRHWGSGNVGATNVARVLGFRRGVGIFCLDVLKGVGAVGLFGWTAARWLGMQDATIPGIACAVAAILGHTYPCWLRFKGGKGVATALGTWLMIAPIPTLIALAVWVLFAAIFRYVSLASIVASVALPATVVLTHLRELGGSQERTHALALLIFSGLLAVLIIVRHRANIVRLLAGTESKIDRLSGDLFIGKPEKRT